MFGVPHIIPPNASSLVEPVQTTRCPFSEGVAARSLKVYVKKWSKVFVIHSHSFIYVYL